MPITDPASPPTDYQLSPVEESTISGRISAAMAAGAEVVDVLGWCSRPPISRALRTGETVEMQRALYLEAVWAYALTLPNATALPSGTSGGAGDDVGPRRIRYVSADHMTRHPDWVAPNPDAAAIQATLDDVGAVHWRGPTLTSTGTRVSPGSPFVGRRIRPEGPGVIRWIGFDVAKWSDAGRAWFQAIRDTFAAELTIGGGPDEGHMHVGRAGLGTDEDRVTPTDPGATQPTRWWFASDPVVGGPAARAVRY